MIAYLTTQRNPQIRGATDQRNRQNRGEDFDETNRRPCGNSVLSVSCRGRSRSSSFSVLMRGEVRLDFYASLNCDRVNLNPIPVCLLTGRSFLDRSDPAYTVLLFFLFPLSSTEPVRSVYWTGQRRKMFCFSFSGKQIPCD